MPGHAQKTENTRPSQTVVIAGAGPAGLTAAYELLSKGKGLHVIICEQSAEIGGISRTVHHNGNLIDIGGHRFFSKDSRILEWWSSILPSQGAPASDDMLIGNNPGLADGGPDPEKDDLVMLRRRRVSRILYKRKFYDYPISANLQTFTNMGVVPTLMAGAGFLSTAVRKRDPEVSLEDFYINRFGKPLYKMFFEDYTRKVWGKHPSELGADWGSQRVKGLSVKAIIKDIMSKKSHRGTSEVETSLITEFLYPKYGPGHLWQTVADRILQMGGEIRMQTCVCRVNIGEDGAVKSVVTADTGANCRTIACDHFISSMPVKELVPRLRGCAIPAEVSAVAEGLPYRDFITVGLLVDKLRITNTTRLSTYHDRIPDTWLYIQERDVHVGRLQVFNNWSPYMVRDYKNTMWIGLEFFCDEGDGLWNKPQDEFTAMAIGELVKIGIIYPGAVRDSVVIKEKKAYPAYHGTYRQLGIVREFLDTIPNLYCVGRNGQHRYNNMDHSMLTAMEAASCIIRGERCKDSIWDVNTDTGYHESTK